MWHTMKILQTLERTLNGRRELRGVETSGSWDSTDRRQKLRGLSLEPTFTTRIERGGVGKLF